MNTLVPKLLELLSFSNTSNDDDIEIKSLQCLIEMSKFQLHLVVPFRTLIINKLESVLDHRSRSVRRLACDCREVYYELGQPKAE
ncbi:unnamed protein product [Ambrosiozyma monospora]|uniref:Unnamed protein product n=1 Tax=Ambrosiozyma monospora TaxID=43982 RepID=A0ACB5TX89_AMBMO|nr:unnamed protein product [Ambrosiozyma monospora]